jgi:ubiquinone/menaquinone biosynthesis C-methylase UbiE
MAKPKNVVLRVLHSAFLVYLFSCAFHPKQGDGLKWSENWLSMSVVFILGQLCVDGVGAFSHFFLDNYWTDNTPIVGSTVYYFRLHHVKPKLMLSKDWIDTNTELTVGTVVFCLFFRHVLGAMSPLWDWFWFIGCLFGSFTSTVHACLHRDPTKNPIWFKILHKMHIVCDPEHHQVHHRKFMGEYSLYLGKVDPILEMVWMWEILEFVIYVVFGVVAVNPRLKKYIHLTPELGMYDRYTNAFWNVFYAVFSWYFKKNGLEIRSMNWGYHWGDDLENKVQTEDSMVLTKAQIEQVLIGASSDLWEVEKFSLQLYRKNVSAVPGGLSGKDVADVSCGKGGGIRMLSELGMVGDSKGPNSVVGMDFSPVNIAECNESYKEGVRPACLSFQQGSAIDIPFDDESKDVIISTEASHCYPSKLLFLQHVKRVLRKNGRLCIVDFMRDHQYAAYKEAIKEAGLVMEKDESILEEVIRASRKVSAVKEKYIETRLPWYMHYFAKRFTNTADSVTFHKFVSKTYDYRWFTIKKPEATN